MPLSVLATPNVSWSVLAWMASTTVSTVATEDAVASAPSSAEVASPAWISVTAEVASAVDVMLFAASPLTVVTVPTVVTAAMVRVCTSSAISSAVGPLPPAPEDGNIGMIMNTLSLTGLVPQFGATVATLVEPT